MSPRSLCSQKPPPTGRKTPGCSHVQRCRSSWFLLGAVYRLGASGLRARGEDNSAGGLGSSWSPSGHLEAGPSPRSQLPLSPPMVVTQLPRMKQGLPVCPWFGVAHRQWLPEPSPPPSRSVWHIMNHERGWKCLSTPHFLFFLISSSYIYFSTII